MRLIAYTQAMENYGSPEEPYWKPKIGGDYIVANLSYEEAKSLTPESITALVDKARVECPEVLDVNGEMWREWVISWEVLDGLTEFEAQQQEYDGKITYPAVDVYAEATKIRQHQSVSAN